MAESRTEPNRVIVNVVHQDHHSNSVTTVSGETRPAASNSSVSTVQANHANGIRGNLLPVSSGIVTLPRRFVGIITVIHQYSTLPSLKKQSAYFSVSTYFGSSDTTKISTV